jgi:Reverse transcriptase (RNA-dependent DNA polymerase)
LIKKLGADASEPVNYRPITNLNTIGKMLERLAQNQLRQHISISPNYNTSQSAYRALHSTETVMTKVVNDLLMAVDSGKPTVLLSLDISAAFDMLDHDRLLNHATELFGLSGQVINWLESYLTGRTSYVSIGNCCSSTVNCSTGVPQGSVLGPLLFPSLLLL